MDENKAKYSTKQVIWIVTQAVFLSFLAGGYVFQFKILSQNLEVEIGKRQDLELKFDEIIKELDNKLDDDRKTMYRFVGDKNDIQIKEIDKTNLQVDRLKEMVIRNKVLLELK